MSVSARQLNSFVIDRNLVHNHMHDNDDLVQSRLLDVEAIPEITRRVRQYVRMRIPIPPMSANYERDLVHGVVQKLLFHAPTSDDKRLALYLHRVEGPRLVRYLCSGWPRMPRIPVRNKKNIDETYRREIKPFLNVSTTCTDLVVLSQQFSPGVIDRIGLLFARDFLTGRRQTKTLAIIRAGYLRGLFWVLQQEKHTPSAACCVLT